ncbi:universal stress protein [Taklimakanibacter deserti]|uniref:universal stress protein n=1 Tax=Taklimakanibacter deserti TaxID=2267839 RepID=UPI000E64B05E
MSYKTILVSLNDLQRNHPLLEATAGLARDLEAHLRAIYVIPAVEIYDGAGPEATIFEGNRQLFTQAEKSVRSAFDSARERFGIRGDIIVIDSTWPDITGHVIDQARLTDIAIVNQPPGESSFSVVGRNFVERILLSTGRPTLVLPREGRTSFGADVVVLGWSGTRESTRAAFDSVPLLKRAKKVEIVWVDPEKNYPHPGSVPADVLAATLSRHGVNTEIRPASTGGTEAGEALLTVVANSGAELLVMGAYGHSRLSEMILGGATKSVLRGMKCPVLFSH